MDESVYVKYLKMVAWRIEKGSIDYKLFNEKDEFLCTIKIAHGKKDKEGSYRF